ncbi:KpsF/GutQ family sugar-phosphate isomerase [Longirhabdus pacifica]|uniref:KpsF/GutQ family sugar-phosphate isomerase n=1 Tax=Longirhabdus pacifica TaxID=2305227 RepID=UPI001008D25C|nr:KpsF/GutQ family sugar-phosphate isomerase [Longirhabdus pacifica]
MDFIQEGKRVFDIEIKALELVRDSLNDDFLRIIHAITNCKGKVIITGMGKPGHIGRKIAATMASLGTSSFFLHPAEALHGDLGTIGKEDVVIAFSYSGESDEVTRILSNIKAIGATLIGISGNADSTLIKHSDIAQVFTKFEEACYMGLAPTSSTTASLVYGDALAIVASKFYGFNENNYGLYHPAGSLGKKLFIKVKNIMAHGDNNAFVFQGETLKKAIIEMGKKGLGIITVVDSNYFIKGVITDGDLRRQLEKGVDVYNLIVDDVMSQNPIVLTEEMMAIEALQILKKTNISSSPVMDCNKLLIGTLRLQDILNAGIVI